MVKVLPLFYKLTNIKGHKSLKIKSGITNINYKVITDNGDFVIRIPRNNIVGLNRENEEKVIELVKDINVDVIYFDSKTGIMISKYVESKKRKQVSFDVMISHLKTLHSLNTDNISSFDPFELINTYSNVCGNKTFNKKEKVIEKAKIIYEKYPLVLCHNDLLYANCISTDNKEYLIDYEYAGKNVALFDIVSFLSENDIDDITSQIKFIKMYYKTIDTQLLSDINTMFLLLDMLWAYWGYAMYELYKEEIFLQIATSKHHRYNIRSYTY